MSRKTKRTVPYRRKREGRTDYQKRLRLLKSEKVRVVVRRSLKHMQVQFVAYESQGDLVKVSAHSRDLQKKGWVGTGGNLPAAYLTGVLAGARAKAAGITDVVLDTGLQTPTKGSRLFGVVKGLLDAGIHIPCSEDILPSDERVSGQHIAAHAKALKENTTSAYEKCYALYQAKGVDPATLPELVEKVKKSILEEKQ